MHEQCDRSCALLGVADTATRGLHATMRWRWFLSVHGSALPGRRRGGMRFLQFVRALIAAHFNRLAADLDLDRISIQPAVASRTSYLNHDIVSLKPEVRV